MILHVEHQPIFDILNKIVYAIRICRQSMEKSDSHIEQEILGERDRKLIEECIENGHTSVLEHVYFSFTLDFSTVAHKQLVRHRISSFSAESQRTVKPNNYYTPQPFRDQNTELGLAYLDGVIVGFEHYRKLVELGAKVEDARYVLPQAARGEILYTANLRSLRNAIAERTCVHSNEEIRNCFVEIKDYLKRLHPVFVHKVEKCHHCKCMQTCGKAMS